MDENRSRVRLLQPDDQFQQDALTGSAATEHRQSFAAANRQINSAQDRLCAEGLVQALQNHGETGAVCVGIFNRVVMAVICRAQRNCIVGAHHGKNTRIIFTKTTSARMTKRDDKTTELVAERPTPSVPP